MFEQVGFEPGTSIYQSEALTNRRPSWHSIKWFLESDVECYNFLLFQYVIYYSFANLLHWPAFDFFVCLRDISKYFRILFLILNWKTSFLFSSQPWFRKYDIFNFQHICSKLPHRSQWLSALLFPYTTLGTCY